MLSVLMNSRFLALFSSNSGLWILAHIFFFKKISLSSQNTKIKYPQVVGNYLGYVLKHYTQPYTTHLDEKATYKPGKTEEWTFQNRRVLHSFLCLKLHSL